MLSKRRNRKKAEITIEVTLSIALSILVLFLALGLFSNNISTMAANSGIARLFNRSDKTSVNSEKTKYDSWGNNPTATQVNVQIVADQGVQLNTLQDYTNWADKIISEYASQPNLTDAQLSDLAKAYTIKSINGGINPTSACDSTCQSHGINVSLKSSGNQSRSSSTSVAGKTITYDSIFNSDTEPLTIVKSVYSANF